MNIFKKAMFAGLMVVAPIAANAVNLVTNGDFELDTATEADPNGWSTDYTFSNWKAATANLGASGPMWAPGSVTVGSNPQAAHSYWESFAAQSGTNMLIVNGADSGSGAVWKTTITALDANTTYEFSVYVRSTFKDSPAKLDFSIGALSLGSVTATDAAWTQYTKTFLGSAAGVSTTGTFLDLNKDYSGNDVAVDNIQIKAVPEPFTMTLVAAGLGLAARRRLRA